MAVVAPLPRVLAGVLGLHIPTPRGRGATTAPWDKGPVPRLVGPTPSSRQNHHPLQVEEKWELADMFHKKVKTWTNPAKQAVGDRKHNQPEAATEMCRVSESSVPQVALDWPRGPWASRFSFCQEAEKNVRRDRHAAARKTQAAPLLPSPLSTWDTRVLQTPT